MSRRYCILLVLPMCIVMLVLAIIPLGYILFMSFFDYSLVLPGEPIFVGLENFERALGCDRFWESVRSSFIYLIRALPIQLALGMGIALLLNRKYRGNNLVRVILASPLVIAPVAAAIMWRLMFNPKTSLINYGISALGITPPIWLGCTDLAMWSIVMVDTWQWLPFVWLILLAGLAALPPELYEAAKIDGASSLRIFQHITLPLLSKQIMLITVFRGLFILRDFEKIMVLTGGGPGRATEMLSLHTHFAAFWWFDIGYASALSILFLLMMAGTSAIIFRRLRL